MVAIAKDLFKHRREFARAIDRHQYERSPHGVVFPKQRAIVQGCFTTWINGRDMQADPNEVPVEALNYLLKAGIKASGGLSAWYIAPFVDNVTPLSTHTAATFDSAFTEFTDYTESARQAWTVPTDPTAGAYTNALSPATFTGSSALDPDDGIDVYGAGILSVAAKNATNGKLLCVSLFNALRNIKPTDKLTVEYELTATSTA
jgi:hypothetical protein